MGWWVDLLSEDPKPSTPRRKVRSFVRREGRITAGQARALQELWPRFGLDPTTGTLDLDAAFGRCAPRLLEIGFGNGDALLEMAAAHPERDHLGIEVHRPGVGRLLRGIEAQDLTNIRVIAEDAVEALSDALPEDAFDQICLYFPDPWPKKRHHKRRIVQPGFVALIRSRLKPGGRFHLATDWAPYAEHMREVMAATPGWEPAPDAIERPRTHFERRGERLGHAVTDLSYLRA
jgi:tRNA (guanine-N7-)-methyltransferase